MILIIILLTHLKTQLRFVPRTDNFNSRQADTIGFTYVMGRGASNADRSLLVSDVQNVLIIDMK